MLTYTHTRNQLCHIWKKSDRERGMTSATHFSELDFVSLEFAHAHYDLTQPDMHTL